MLSEKFTTAILPKQEDNDADVLIIETAIKQINRANTTIVVGENVNLLILLTTRTTIDNKLCRNVNICRIRLLES